MNVAPGYDIAHAHNQFLQTTLDLGIPGLVAYSALWLGAAYLLRQTIVQATDPLMRALAIGVSGAFVGFAVYGLSDAVTLGSKPGFFWWWLLAFSVGAYQLRFASNNADIVDTIESVAQ
jgi:O-antigen ligase